MKYETEPNGERISTDNLCMARKLATARIYACEV